MRDLLGWTGYFVIGVGVGILSAVIGSYAHDALSGGRRGTG
ncbi:MAG TPA: hypothetical protein VF160_10295 [Candidatus Dormibacteraeota bacterium]